MRSNLRRNRKSSPFSASESGFTLIELLISVMILSFISLGLYQAMTETYKLRESLSNEGDFYNGIRLSMNILQRDVTMMYSPIVLIPTPAPSPSNQSPAAIQAAQLQAQQQVQQQAAADPDLYQETDFWGPALDKSGLRPSRFVGSEKKITFISSSHLRLYKDMPESEFAKITYELIQDDADKDAQMLVKTESTDVFQTEERKDVSKRTYALLHGIKSLKFRFYRKHTATSQGSDNGTWERAWDSDSQDQKNLYPDIVEINFEVNGPTKLYFNGIFHFKPELPFNGIDPST